MMNAKEIKAAVEAYLARTAPDNAIKRAAHTPQTGQAEPTESLEVWVERASPGESAELTLASETFRFAEPDMNRVRELRNQLGLPARVRSAIRGRKPSGFRPLGGGGFER